MALVPITCKWNDAMGLRYVCETWKVAAVIFEVSDVDPNRDFVEALHEVRDRFGCLLIADEVVTGFRLALGGACELYDIKPDLACYGKALGSGVPIAAIVGKRDYMREFDLAHTKSPVFMSFTHAGNTLGLAAMIATLEALKDGSVIEHVNKIGTKLVDELRAFRYIRFPTLNVTGQPARHCVKFCDHGSVKANKLLALYQQVMCKHKILVGVTNAPTIAHGNNEVSKTLEVASEAFKLIAQAIDADSVAGLLEGEAPMPLYVRSS